ncbi:hypothetical protein PCASD_05582 [Puccinia coronata f. sp. avenae]|uniref:Mak10 subunit, NatC N(Alpha)-terminal acetyltransferase n=1 Tax=Puccinia coronata f. sp. avenae TaxID=200324 RepID=A0A2N5TC34_9BASI|nr:hypothetical protein PCASD_11027 [Puccinia coronata f. sp. avenae]PLW42173.1 hypothetical protein PCASD_05582 [Puccinia coronata f. sp. avenae]
MDENDNWQEQQGTDEQKDEEEWTDITHILIRGAHQLSKNDILLAQNMSLLDIISAIQIMDPRMDTGVGATSTHNRITLDPLQPLTSSELVTILDLSLACEVTWYTGRLLSQTVLTSSYIHHLDALKSHPDRLVKHVLRACLLGLTKCCWMVSEEICKDHLRENEDVNSEHQTIDIYDKIDITQTLDALDEAYSVLETWPNELDDHRIPLMERVRFRIEFLYSLALLSSSPTSPMIVHLEAHLHSAREAIQAIRLHPTYPAHSPLSFSAQNHPVISAFNFNFHQTVPSHSPPRPVHFPHTFDHLAAMVIRILEELALVYQVTRGNCFSDWLTFFHAFSRREPIAFPFVRSYLMSLFQTENVIALKPTQTLLWLGKECMSNLSAGQVCYPSNSSSANRYMLNRFSGFLVNYLSAFAANRARGRRILSNSLCEWKALYNTTWVNQLDFLPSTLQGLQILIYYFSVESSLHVSLMGFDLELYQEDSDRVAMWWVTERLSERAWLLLDKLSDGAESTHAKMIRVVGKLAGVALQLTCRRHAQSGAPLSELKVRRAVFERRVKMLNARDAVFDDTALVTQLGLARPLLDYQHMASALLAVQTPADLLVTLKHVKQLLSSAADPSRERVGSVQLQSYIRCLTEATDKMMAINQADDKSSSELPQPARDDEPPSLESLRISSAPPSPHLRADSGAPDDDGYRVQDDARSVDVASRWFLV